VSIQLDQMPLRMTVRLVNSWNPFQTCTRRGVNRRYTRPGMARGSWDT
jgi:hypothetical protein